MRQPVRHFSTLLLCAAAAVCLGTACGDDAYDNVDACVTFVDTVDCQGAIPIDEAVTACEQYADWDCDLRDFFECAASYAACDEGGSDLSRALDSCRAEAACL